MLSFLDVRRGERRAVVLAALFFFLILASYYLVRPVRDQLSGANGLKDLPMFYGAVLVCMLLLTPVYGWMVARLPRSRFIPIVYSFFIACLGGYAVWFHTGSDSAVLATSFFVWVSIFNLFVVAVFWSFMADLFDTEQAGRLFPLIALGGSLGTLLGPLLTELLVLRIGVGSLLLVAATLLGLALACALALMRQAERSAQVDSKTPPATHELIGGGLLTGARLVFTNKVIGSLALLMLLSDCIGGFLYALVAEHVRSLNLSAEERTAFYGALDLKTNLIAMSMQLVLARPLLRWLGAGGSFALALSINFALSAWLALSGVAAFAVFALMGTRACAYGLQKPLLDSFYTRVDRESRYKAKAFIDTAVWRFGDLAVVLGMSGWVAMGYVVLSKTGVAVYGGACALAASLSGLLGWSVDRWTRADLAGKATLKPTAHGS